MSKRFSIKESGGRGIWGLWTVVCFEVVCCGIEQGPRRADLGRSERTSVEWIMENALGLMV